jgi:hypothetical protein
MRIQFKVEKFKVQAVKHNPSQFLDTLPVVELEMTYRLSFRL